jgi:hypothetical protein
VRAVNEVGPGPWGASIRVAPFTLTNVTAQTAAPAGNVLVGWTGPAEVGAGVDHYTVYRCITTAGCTNSANWADTGLTIPAGSNSATHACGEGVSCTYKVVAVEIGTGASGAASAAASASGSTLPDAPQNLTAASGATSGSVDLAWLAPPNSGTFPVTDYVFQRSVNSGPFSANISIGGTGLSYTDTACGAGNVCTYKVAAVTASGTGSFSNTATAQGANVPGAPQNLTAAPGASLGAVNLGWQAPLDNGGRTIDQYRIERSLDGGSTWPTTFNVAGTSLSYTDTT